MMNSVSVVNRNVHHVSLAMNTQTETGVYMETSVVAYVIICTMSAWCNADSYLQQPNRYRAGL